MSDFRGNNSFNSYADFYKEFVEFLLEESYEETLDNSVKKQPFIDLTDINDEHFMVLIRNSSRGDEFNAEGDEQYYPCITAHVSSPQVSDLYNFPFLYKEGGVRLDATSGLNVGDIIYFPSPSKIEVTLSSAAYFVRQNAAIVSWLYSKFDIGFHGASMLLNKDTIEEKDTGYAVPYFATINEVERDDKIKQNDVLITANTFINNKKTVTKEVIEAVEIIVNQKDPEGAAYETAVAILTL